MLVGAEQRLGLISDIDDTVISTSLPRPLIAAWNTFVKSENARHVVPGMATMYRALLESHPGAPMAYVSTGAWNTAPTLTRFLRRHGYPAGPLLLTDWGPTNTGWFRSGQDHKRACLHRLANEFPHIRWVLVGDDGQHDPKIYGDFARQRPDRVEAIAIRELTPSEQVLSHGIPVSLEEFTMARDRHAKDVPVCRAADGYGLLRLLRVALDDAVVD
jgi:phosphatidate phosphatase APP1